MQHIERLEKMPGCPKSGRAVRWPGIKRPGARLYAALFCIIALSCFSGGVDSPFQAFFYLVMIMLIPSASPKELFGAAVLFSGLYAMEPFLQPPAYPSLHVILNVFFFLLAGAVSARVAEALKADRDSFSKAADSSQAALTLKIMNIKSEYDSLSASYEQMEEFTESKTRFMSGISDELREGLTGIGALAGTAIRAESDEETRKELLLAIAGETERLLRVVADIPEIMSTEAETGECRLDPLDMEEIVESAFRVMYPLAKDKNLYMKKEIPLSLPLLQGDHGRILQVLLNLISNAIGFTSSGGVTVGVEDIADEVKVFVSDTGKGLPPGGMEIIFGKSDRNGFHGRGESGLGLTVSRKIIEHHGGKIGLESRPGKGATFSFTLPKVARVVHKAEPVE